MYCLISANWNVIDDNNFNILIFIDINSSNLDYHSQYFKVKFLEKKRTKNYLLPSMEMVGRHENACVSTKLTRAL